MIDFDNKKILIWLDQTESTEGKNIIIDNNAAPRMIMPKNLEVEVQKVDERKRKLALRPKPTSKQLLDKYTSCKANNVFSRLRGAKLHRSHSRPGGHERWQGNSYDQQLYFPVEPACWSCPPPIYPQFSLRDFKHWASYRTRPRGYFHPKYIMSRPMFRRDMHEKRDRFSPNVRLNEVVVIHDNDKKPISGISSLHGRCGAGDRNYNNDCKRMWVPVRPAGPESTNAMVSEHAKGSDADHVVISGGPKIAKSSSSVQYRQKGDDLIQNKSVSELGLQNGKEGSSIHARNIVTCDGLMHGCTKRTNLKADLKNMEVRTEKYVVRPSTSKPVFVSISQFRESSLKVRDNGKASYGIKLREHQSSEGVVNSTETSSDVEKASVQKEVVCTEEDANCAELPQTGSDKFEKETSSNLNLHNGGDKALFVSSSICQKLDSVNRRTNSAMRCISSGTSKNLPPVGFKYSINTSTRWDSSNRGRHGVESSHVFDQQMVLSVRDKIFAPKATVCKYRPRNLGGNIIKSIAPEIKPRPQWCPKGLTHTQKRRVQRLRALKIKEDITLKKCDELFRRVRPTVPPNMTWREKRITTEENRNMDDMVHDGISENTSDTPTDLDIDKGG
jgi:hypothetical protein